MPEVWPTLMQAAEQSLDQDGHIALDAKARETICETLTELNGHELTRIRYYLLNQAICNVARRMGQPDHREAITGSAASRLHGLSQELRGGVSGLYHAANHEAISDTLQPTLIAAYEALPPEVRLVDWHIRAAQYQRSALPARNPEEDAEGTTVIQLKAANVFAVGESDKQPTVQSLRHTMLLSSGYIVRKILAGRTPGLSNGALPTPDVLDSLYDPSIKETAVKMCGLIGSQALGQSGEVIEVGQRTHRFVRPQAEDTEQIEFDDPEENNEIYGWRGRTYVTRDPDTSLICPALNVPGMVELSIDFTIDVIAQAIKMARQNQPKPA